MSDSGSKALIVLKERLQVLKHQAWAINRSNARQKERFDQQDGKREHSCIPSIHPK